MAVGTDGGQATPVGCDGELFADAWDVYFRAPLSLSLVANTFAHNGMQGELGQLLDDVLAGFAGRGHKLQSIRNADGA